ncbi:MAG: 3-isopropylmalate/(R)-2-methylmalate dehydratase large subunit [Thermosediminibacterales bacterium]|nr:3-isopropylmalate/(R)-2-methylmalate dehydratase large subunit [Thermosediminibacterales bacterium]
MVLKKYPKTSDIRIGSEDMGKTVAEKILSEHSNKDLKAGDIALCNVDFLMASDTTAPIAIKSFYNMGGQKVKNPDKTAFVLDHASPCPNQKIAALHTMMREFASEQNIILYDVGEGICHQLIIENGHIKAGELVLGADSHTCTYGAIGALACGVGATDLAAAMFTGKSWFKVPETIRINLHGKFPSGVYAKDLILYLIGKLGSNGATYKSVEFYGEPLEKMTLSSKLTITNMVVEMGAKNGVICDSTTGMKSDPDARFERIIDVNLSKLEAYVAAPHRVDNIKKAKDLSHVKINQGFLGSCTNGRIEDLRIAAQILKGKRIPHDVRLLITPASKKVFLQAVKEGLVETLIEAGGVFITPGCGACVGTHNGIPGDNENVISSTNRNFKGRMGNNKAFIYLASPATVAASVLKGRITDPKEL